MFNSMQTRLTLWHTGLVAAVLILFALTTYNYVYRATSRKTIDSLIESVNSYSANISTELAEGDQSPSDAISEVTNGIHFADRQFAVFDRNLGLVAISSAPQTAQSRELWPNGSQFLELADRQRTTEAAQQSRLVSGLQSYSTVIHDSSGPYYIVAVESLAEQNQTLAPVRRAFFIAVPAAVLLSWIGGWFLARRNLKPVVEMGAQAKLITSRNMQDRINLNGSGDELRQFGVIINDLLSRLSLAFEQQQRFMADASHELRTPLTIIRTEAEVALSRRGRTNDEYLGSLEVVSDEGRRMTRIVEDLFVLSRGDSGDYPLQRSQFYIEDLIGECVRDTQTLAARRGVTLRSEPAEEMAFVGDEQLIARLLMNVIDNAVKHTPNGGAVSVKATRNADCHIVEISDSGPGIPAEIQSHIFERFFRADKARSRSENQDGGGAGLGLSIAQWIANVHGGRVSLIKSDGCGSVFEIRLPHSTV